MNNPIRKVLITGASEGIGKALALRYAAAGSELLLLARNEELLREVSEKIISIGGKAHFKKCDVTDRAEVIGAVQEALEKMERIDVAVLNAGVSGKTNFNDFTASQVENIFRTNLFGIVYFMEQLVPAMKSHGGGRIIGISSIADSRGFPGAGPYSASKSAVTKLLESARIDLKGSGIDVVTVRPGFIRTKMAMKNDFYMPFMLELDEAAGLLFNALESGRKRYSFPWQIALLADLTKLIPDWIFDRAFYLWNKYLRGR